MWAALFPGQGSQHPGMGKFLYGEFKVAKETFEEASDALSQDLKKLCFDGSDSDLALTENTQPALLLVSVATFRVLQSEFEFKPGVAAGHSVGEYAALVSAQSLDFRSAMSAVRVRGQAMQNAVPVGQGGMTAVLNLELSQVTDLCRWAERESGEQPVQAANINAPGQIVISGKKSILDWIAENYSPQSLGITARVKFIPLKVSAPFHCAMMKPAEEKMAQVLGEMHFSDAQFPVVQNVSAEPVTDHKDLCKNLIAQVCAPVRWTDCVHKILSLGARRAVEVGSGKVLCGLAKKIAPENLPVMNLNSMDDVRAFEIMLKGGSRA
jgi:[acyl-carrier-protein] S-malonyltransferase